MDLIYDLVCVWVKTKTRCGNNYKCHGFVRGLKKLVDDVFGSSGRGLKKGSMTMWAKISHV